MKIKNIEISSDRREENLARRNNFESRWHRFVFEESYGSITLTGPNAWSLKKTLGDKNDVFFLLSEETETGETLQESFDEAFEGDAIIADIVIACENYKLIIVKDYEECKQALGVGFVAAFNPC